MGKNEKISPTSRKKTRVSTLSTLIYCSAQTLNQNNKARQRNKSDTNRKRRNQSIPI
jgi:hypothetical protein